MIRRKVLSSRRLSGLWRTWELKLSCGHTREFRPVNASVPKTSYCGHCTRGHAQPGSTAESNRRFTGVVELERTGYIPEGSATERESTPRRGLEDAQ